MRWSERRKRFRAILAGSQCIYPGSVFDPMSARIAEDLGFEAGIFAGSVASMTVLGAPDLIVLTLSEFAEQTGRICRAGNLPLIVDADHGYGNALNVMRTVEELEKAGVAALSIEDTELPPPFGSADKPRLTSLAEGVGKMRAALAARRDPDLVIAGRTSAMAIEGVDAAVERARAYAAEGVDALFMVGVKTRDQLEAITAVADLPLILGNPGAELIDEAYLSAQNVRVCIRGHQPIAAAVEAVYRTLKALRAGTPPGEIENLPSTDLLKAVTRAGDYQDWTDWFLGGGD